MPAFKVRRRLIAPEIQFSNGNTIDRFSFGIATTGCTPSLTTVTAGTGSLVVPNAAVGDFVMVQPASMPAGLIITGVKVTAASVITASFYNSGSATINQNTLTYNVLVISGS